MKYIVVIPARYESSRFPGKPLAKIGGVEMIVRVCRQVEKAGVDCAVATDDRRIYDCVKDAGYLAVMTSSACKSGTERVAEAYEKMQSDADVVINVQGDEPFICPEQIVALTDMFRKYPDTEIATLAKRFLSSDGYGALEDPNLVKLVVDGNDNALYFSRSVIPYVRKAERKEWPVCADYLTHIGIYAYRTETLKRIVKLPESMLESAESLEQLRWLENGIRIKIGITEYSTIGIDTPADLEAAEQYVKNILR